MKSAHEPKEPAITLGVGIFAVAYTVALIVFYAWAFIDPQGGLVGFLAG